ncbi:DUF6348 family protein [Actinomadura parmotrematis]|uniref:Thioesterase family protein n=1 Tax=Actinomadura parmotrematis TaxID=2864039 RepID=A0ABS7FYS0_9ACTN|nr:DUF6348 family protein [Actinomadura parmotrematis]MBW8485586.1 hypothetical protein [Actinomadura parmotrematis]
MGEGGGADVAGLIARALAGEDGLRVRQDGDAVELRDGGLRVLAGAPLPQERGAGVRVPIGVGHAAWAGALAWDQAVGIAEGDRSPVERAVDGWLRHVLPVFAAMALPGSAPAAAVRTERISGGGRAVDVHYGPVAIRDFGGIAAEMGRAAAERPPAGEVVRELFTGYALPERPVWLSSFHARGGSAPVAEVVLLNRDTGAAFAHAADHLPWGGRGSVRSWALVVPTG